MIVSIDLFEWQLLRVIVRGEAKGELPTGRELRVNPTSWSKDGTFLDDLVKLGLIAVAAKPTPPLPGRRDEPAQFRTRYELTDLGRHAAEYGEYEKQFVPTATELTGTAAELAELNGAEKKPMKRKPKK